MGDRFGGQRDRGCGWLSHVSLYRLSHTCSASDCFEFRSRFGPHVSAEVSLCELLPGIEAD